MKQLNFDNYIITPWKNGLGTTAQVAISPSTSTLQEMNFDWRISIASINSANSFSLFPEFQRILTVWKGNGVKLNNKILRPFEFFCFKGDEKINCELIDGSVEDLGLIYNSKKYKAEMRLIKETHFAVEIGSHFLFDPQTKDCLQFSDISELPKKDFKNHILISLWQMPQH